MREQAIWKKNILGRGNNKCKGPKARTCLEHMKNRKNANENKWSRRG